MNLFRWRHRKDEELHAEIRHHLDEAIRDRLARGESPDEARLNARREFGNVGLVKEVTREMWGWAWLEALGQDLRFGLRMLRKNPGFSLIAVFTLALGIGVTTAIFTVLNSFVLKPLPLKDPGSIVYINGYNRDAQRNRLFSYADYLDYRDRSTSFVGLIAMNKFTVPFGEQSASIDADEAAGNVGYGRLVSGNYFAVLGAEMALGRGFTPAEDQTPSTHPVLVLSHLCWERRFNSDPQIIGKTVRVAGQPFTVIGVTAQGFVGLEPDAPHFWIPLMMRDQVVGNWLYKSWLTERKADAFMLAGRLKPDVLPAQAQAELNVMAQQLANDHPDPQRKVSLQVNPGATFIQLDDKMKLLIAPVLMAVGLILLIACINVTNMLLARAAGRQREIAVRLALGASRWRVMRQMLTESVLLSGVGGALGLLLARWTIQAVYPLVLAQLPVPQALLEQFALDMSPDYRVFGAALLVSLLAGITAGLTPALQASRPNLSGALKNEGSTFGAYLSQSRLRNALVVAQVAVCLTLLIGAGLLTRSLQKAQTIETGLVTNNVFMLDTTAQGTQRESERGAEFCRQLAARVRALPGVKCVSQAQQLPLFGPTRTTPITLAGQPQPVGRPLQAGFNFVSAEYFQTFDIRLKRGRSFTAQEAQANAQVVVISDATAQRFWPNEDALGKHLGIGAAAQMNKATNVLSGDSVLNFPQYEVIGIARDTRQGLLWQPDDTFLYVPLRTDEATGANSALNLLVSAEGDVQAVMAAARKEAAALDPKSFVIPHLMEEGLALQRTPLEIVAVLAGVLGLLALLLASIGLYGVMSFVVSQRTREIGIRVALGAQGRDCIRLFLRQGGKLIAIGIALGLAGGAAISGLLAGVLVDISRFDPLTFCLVAAVLTGVALSACYVPARRATKVDPIAALRHE